MREGGRPGGEQRASVRQCGMSGRGRRISGSFGRVTGCGKFLPAFQDEATPGAALLPSMIRRCLVALVPAVVGLGTLVPAAAQESAQTATAPAAEAAAEAQAPAEAVAEAPAAEAAANSPAETVAEAPAAAFAVGQPVPALPELEYLQGEPLPAALNEPGKVYLIDCWATWCGPCIAAMPHLAQLHRDFSERGLVVLAANVWEQDTSKVPPFLEEQKENMPFAVALTGDESGEFAKQWLEAAGVNGIPSTFIVADGKLVFHGHPSEIDDAMIEAVLAGSFDAEEFAAARAAAEAKENELRTLVMGLVESGNWQGVLDNQGKIAETNPDMARHLGLLARVKLGQFDEIKKEIAALPADSATEMDQGDLYGMVAQQAPASEGLSAFAQEAAPALEALPVTEDPMGKALETMALLRFQALAGQDAATRQPTLDRALGELDAAVTAQRLPQPIADKFKTQLREANQAEAFPPLEEVLRPN